MDERNKAAFWAVAAGAFLLVCVPSTVLLEAFTRYKGWLDGVDPGALRPTRVHSLPHRDVRRGQPASRLDFVEFSLKRPKAKKVTLIGDFNGWKDDSLPLARQSDGRWELTLPLPQGRHHYLFVVDGNPELDPGNREVAEADGRRASVKVVR